MQIILFGGAFDPPHLGHEQVTASLLKNHLADEVWYVPVGVHDFDKNLSKAKHRLAMLDCIVAPHTRIETCEIHRKGVSHTYDTLEQLSNQYPQHQFSWVIGSDNLDKFHLWHKYQDMLKKYKFYVYPRANYDFHPLYLNMIPLKEMRTVEVSSTQIRCRVKRKQSIKQFVNSQVEKYIYQNSLYK